MHYDYVKYASSKPTRKHHEHEHERRRLQFEQSSLHAGSLGLLWAFQTAFLNITDIARDRPDKMSLLFCKGKCGIVPPRRSPSGCEWPSNQALPFTAAGLQRAAGLTSEGPASPSPSSGTLQQALEAKWGVSLLKGSLCVDHSPSGGGSLCLVIQVRLISFCSTRRHEACPWSSSHSDETRC